MSHSTADPRPRTEQSADGVTVRGWRCVDCRYPSAQVVTRCPVCRGQVADASFATEGVVFASTCLRVRVPGRVPPFAMAYLTLDDGPRILVHTPGGTPLTPGARAAVTSVDEAGDPIAEETR